MVGTGQEKPTAAVGVNGFGSSTALVAFRLLTVPNLAAHAAFFAPDLAPACTATSTAHAILPSWFFSGRNDRQEADYRIRFRLGK
jgi:hypothetical protein